MTNTPLVSIIIPTYNRAHLIGDTLDSIKNQTYTHWECLVVDDGSIDTTEDLLKRYIQQDSRFQYYKRPEYMPKGANACRNFGFDQSKGDYINWFDSDDIMLPKKLELQVHILLKEKQVPYCICQSQWYDLDNDLDLGMRSKFIESKNRFEDYVLQHIIWLTTAPLWRREFIEENHLRFDDMLHQSQEYDFHIKALNISEAYATVNVPLVKIIKHIDAISSNFYDSTIKVMSHLRVKQRIFEYYHFRLSQTAKIKLFENLTLVFKDLLVLKKFKLALKALYVQIVCLKYIKLPLYKKLLFSLKLILTFVTYRIFGKGYSLVAPIKQTLSYK